MKKIVTLALTLTMAAGAFAQDWTWASKDKDGFVAVNAAKIKGDVLTGGSGTIYPIAQSVADQFKGEGFTGQLSVDNIGSGAGLKRFGAGELDIANASREINAGEKDAVAKLNKGKLVEVKVAIDALVILVNGKNTSVKNLSKDQVKALFSTAEKWSDVDPSWPKEKINRYIPETSHGTFDYFQEHFWNDKGAVLKAAANTQRFQDYNQQIAAIEKDKNGIGFIGFAYYKESDNAKAVTFEGVAASRASVEAKTYGIARFLYLYSTEGILTSKPAAAAYLAFFLNNANRTASKVGYFPLPAAELAAQKKLLADTVAGKF